LTALSTQSAVIFLRSVCGLFVHQDARYA